MKPTPRSTSRSSNISKMRGVRGRAKGRERCQGQQPESSQQQQQSNITVVSESTIIFADDTSKYLPQQLKTNMEKQKLKSKN